MLARETACSQAVADAIPRYAEPAMADGNEPEGGTCDNCLHRVPVELGGKTYQLCVHEADSVNECDPEMEDCDDWDWDGNDEKE